MSSRILAIATLAASLAAIPMLASAQTTTGPGGMPSTTMGTSTPATMPSDSMPSGAMPSGTMPSGGMNEGAFNARNYRTGADCLNAATAAHVALSACDNLRKR